jgi:site-specific DNA recombinase
MEQKMYKAACYCRLSDDDVNDGMSISIETQITIHKQYCKANQIQIVDFYCDDGYTGTNFERPAFKRMLEDIRAKKVDTVIVKDLSRFGREHIEVGYFTQIFFPENNVTFIIIADNTIITPRSKYDMMLPLRSVINEMLPAEVSQKVRQAFEAKSLNGEFLHPWLPYGYKKSTIEKNKLVVDEENAPTVVTIFELVAYHGMGMSNIAEYL